MRLSWIFTIVFIIYSKQVFCLPLRIVSLAPNLTEIIYALNLGNNLVGDTVQCDYPLEARHVYKVGDYVNPNLERILASRPTVVLAAQGNPRWLINKLKALGIRVLETNPKLANDLPTSIEEVANKLGAPIAGKKISESVFFAITQLQNHKKKHKKFLLILQMSPLYSVSNNTWLGNLFFLAGWDNIVQSSALDYPVLSQEYLIKNQPEVVFYTPDRATSLQKNQERAQANLKKIFVVDGIHFLETLS